jgi:hypothetical protein
MYDANSMSLVTEVNTHVGATLDAAYLEPYKSVVTVGVDRCVTFWSVLSHEIVRLCSCVYD